MAPLIAACLALAALSLLAPSEASYDPLAWAVWGRELPQLELDTSGGPSWKPLPVAVIAVAAPLGQLDPGVPAAVWMVVARAGALLAPALALRLVVRLTGGGPAGWAGGVLAALALVLVPDWFQFAAHGSEAPLAVALMLAAVDRGLDRRSGQVVALGVSACLLRPELVLFLGAYGVWAWATEPALRLWLVAAAGLVAAAWLVPDWIGSGNPIDGGRQARSEPPWSLSRAERPWLRALERVHNHSGAALELAALAALGWALVARRRAVLGLGAGALAALVLFAAMTQAGFSGNPRYLLAGVALTCVLAGVGVSALLAGRGPAVAATGAALLALAFAPSVAGGLRHVRVEAREVGVRMEIHRDLGEAVDALGGPGAVGALGSATANRALHSRLAWELGVPISAVEAVTEHSLVFRSGREHLVGRVYVRGPARARETILRVGSLRVVRRVYFAFAGISHGAAGGGLRASG